MELLQVILVVLGVLVVRVVLVVLVILAVLVVLVLLGRGLLRQYLALADRSASQVTHLDPRPTNHPTTNPLKRTYSYAYFFRTYER